MKVIATASTVLLAMLLVPASTSSIRGTTQSSKPVNKTVVRKNETSSKNSTGIRSNRTEIEFHNSTNRTNYSNHTDSDHPSNSTGIRKNYTEIEKYNTTKVSNRTETKSNRTSTGGSGKGK
jgi:hypothetical protein